MRNVKKFEMFGVEYKTIQFSAIEGFDLVDVLAIVTPLEMLKHTHVIKHDGKEIRLDSQRAIDEHVKDSIGRVAPTIVLRGLMNIVSNHSFGFLKEWKGTKIPSRFISESKNVESEYIEPVVANMLTSNMATIKELEEYYSLYDAFVMFEALVVKSVNEAYAHEAAENEAKSKR